MDKEDKETYEKIIKYSDINDNKSMKKMIQNFSN